MLFWFITDGPDDPILEAHPAQPFYVSGDSLNLTCWAEGVPRPTAEWAFGGQTLRDSHRGVLHITNAQTSQGGIYTCTLRNEQTEKQLKESVTVNVYGM